MSTPHNGSKTVDRLLGFPDSMVRFVARCSDIWMRILGDKNPNAYQVYHSFSTMYAKKFNETNLEHPEVYYQSYAFVMKHCYSDILLCIPNLVVRMFEGENDGLLSLESVKWGHFKGIIKSTSNRGISHCDEVDMRRRRFSKRQGDGINDIVQLYGEIVKELAEKGFSVYYGIGCAMLGAREYVKYRIGKES